MADKLEKSDLATAVRSRMSKWSVLNSSRLHARGVQIFCLQPRRVGPWLGLFHGTPMALPLHPMPSLMAPTGRVVGCHGVQARKWFMVHGNGEVQIMNDEWCKAEANGPRKNNRGRIG